MPAELASLYYKAQIFLFKLLGNYWACKYQTWYDDHLPGVSIYRVIVTSKLKIICLKLRLLTKENRLLLTEEPTANLPLLGKTSSILGKR